MNTIGTFVFRKLLKPKDKYFCLYYCFPNKNAINDMSSFTNIFNMYDNVNDYYKLDLNNSKTNYSIKIYKYSLNKINYQDIICNRNLKWTLLHLKDKRKNYRILSNVLLSGNYFIDKI